MLLDTWIDKRNTYIITMSNGVKYLYINNHLIYMGELNGRIRHGYGTSYHTDGNVVYTGFWKNDMPTNKLDIHELRNGVKFKGQMKNGVCDGSGVLCIGGYEMQCTFYKGLLHGLAVTHMNNYIEKTMYDKGTITYVELWYKGYLYIKYVNNILTQYYPQSNKILYIGEMGVLFNSRSGTGTSYDKNGYKKYTGQWQNNQPNGSGVFYENGKIVYKGEVKNNLKHGFGVCKYNNITLNGLFIDDYPADTIKLSDVSSASL